MTEAQEFLGKLRRLSALDSYLSNFVEGIADFIKPDGMLHVRLNQHITATGRFSGSNPNMQNMPRGNTFPVKRVFVSRWEGGKVMEADFAQLEFRVAAFLSQDAVAMKEVSEGFDVHSYTAKVITDAGQPTSRQVAKTHTFAPLYGATGYGRTPAEAAYYTHFMEKYKGVAGWHKTLAKQALAYGYISIPSGREFVFPDVKRKRDGTVTNFTQIKNYPVQSFATADIVPLALVEIYNRLQSYRSCVVNSVHDSIVVDVHPEEQDEVIEVIDNVQKSLVDLINARWGIDFNVPLALEAKIGNNWLEQKDVQHLEKEIS
jgi:DNA polymerase-1